ncbi:kinase-like domain-containing protein [Pilobolus umbonatus]|nr:kinase-like domain-containing protein [Pilobolus umbonatus]
MKDSSISNPFWTHSDEITMPLLSPLNGHTNHKTLSTNVNYTMHDTAEQASRSIPANNNPPISRKNQINASTKRYQTKMLLVSLIEYFCRSYGDSPDANRKVFFLICQTLRSLGIIDAEFVDEMTSIRSSFQSAFHKLFFTAVETVRNNDILPFSADTPKMIMFSRDHLSTSETSLEPCTPISNDNQSTEYFSSHSHPIPTSASNPPPSFLSSDTQSFLSANTQFTNASHDLLHSLSVQNSRYHNDFIEISLLGKGGFASAFRARNKLDGIDYAIKKIRLGNDIVEESSNSKHENPYEKIFREIKNLARLEHHNVIRYYSSWLEYNEESTLKGRNTQTDSTPTDTTDWDDNTSCADRTNQSDTSSIFHGLDPTFDDEPCYDESGMSQIEFLSRSTSNTSVQSIYEEPIRPSKALKKKGDWILYIQMQLCPTTLHDYIKFRNQEHSKKASSDIDAEKMDAKRNIEIFTQILEGTAYIHDQGLIHRDLKPSNIFLSMPNLSNATENRKRRPSANHLSDSMDTTSAYGVSPSSFNHGRSFDSVMTVNGLRESMWDEAWIPKIGDFGLAAEVITEETHEDSLVTPVSSATPSPPEQLETTKVGQTIHSITLISSSPTHEGNSSGETLLSKKASPKRPSPKRTRTIGVGTRTYASPEQLADPPLPYDEKVDIYSLGIILFELFQPFSTGMERADAIDKLKRGVFPEGFLELYPKISALILWMMDENPDCRPSSHQLLEFELFTHPNNENIEVYESLQSQLQAKNIALEFKNKEIDELKQRLEQVEQEKNAALREMQKQLDEMQYKLDTITKVCKPPSLKHKKKEVSWASIGSG